MNLKIDDRDAAISDIRLILSYPFDSKIYENVIKRLMLLESGRIFQELTYVVGYEAVTLDRSNGRIKEGMET